MCYKQITKNCFSKDLISEEDIKLLQIESMLALQEVRLAKFPILELANRTDDLAEIEVLGEHIASNFEHLVVLGTGGSVLCGHAMVGFNQRKYDKQRVIFMENIDPATFESLFASINLSKTAFLTISKSGTSVETLTQMLYCLQRSQLNPAKHFFSICMDMDSPLRKISAELGIKTLNHDPEVGGRFSILSLVGLIPALVAGADIRKLRAGAAKFLAEKAEYAAEMAAIHVAFMRKNYWQNVLVTYPDNLEDLNVWYRQIWAESIGKNGTGSTPIKSKGTIDQHSQMQLYLGGRKDKLYSFITLEFADNQPLSTSEPRLSYLNNRTMAEVMNAEQRATVETLVKKGRPVRVIEIQKLDEEALGMLIMHQMLETIITGKLLGVNPFDQPAVEDGKVKTRELLSKI